MGNEYRKLLKSQFGKKNYADFVRSVKTGVQSNTIIHKEVYQAIYRRLRTQKQGALVYQHRMLEEAIFRVVRIGKTYAFAVGLYLLAVLLLLVYGTVPVLTYTGLALVTLAFAVKTAEYIGNKFCYVDVRIILTYKSALERLIVESEDFQNALKIKRAKER